MIAAVIFDMDGTLVQTESLKAESYARAITQLRKGAVRHEDVIAAYDPLIGRSRSDVVRTLMERFDLHDTDALVALRLRIYDDMISDHELLKKQEYPHSTALLRSVKQRGYPTALTTVSHAREAYIILDALDLRRYFDSIVTIDDVARAKPSPDLYLVAAARLGVQPVQCLAIEDSLAGVEAAVAAGMQCVAIANELTRKSLHAQPPFPGEHLVDDPRELGEVVGALLGMEAHLSQPLGHA
jgi:beta-phosphoglucomutase